jgi:biotin transport system substrate-specific component
MATTDPAESTATGTSARPVPRSTPGRTSRRLTTTDLALVAAFAALIAACALVGEIPVGGSGVGITLQTFGVMLAGCVLGPVRGPLAVLLYLALGAIGLPVFSGHTSGLGVFTGASAGYLIAFPLAALVAGLLVRYVAGPVGRTRALVVFLCSAAGSLLVIHPLGIIGMKLFFDTSWSTAASYDAPFWIVDVLKTTLVALVAAEVHRAFPQLLQRR